MLKSSSLPAPHRVFLPGCALAAGLLLMAPLAQAAPADKTAGRPAATLPAMKLRVGKTATYPLAAHTSVLFETGNQHASVEAKDGALTVKALSAGAVRLRLEAPGQVPRFITLQLVESAATAEIAAPQSESTDEAASEDLGLTTLSPPIPPIDLGGGNTIAVSNRASSQVVDRTATPGAVPQRAPLSPLPPLNSGPVPAAAAPVVPASPTPPVNLGPVPAAVAPSTVAPSTVAPVAPAAGTPVAPGAVAPAVAAPANPFQLLAPDFGGPLAPPTTASPTSEFPANPIPPQQFPPTQLPPTNVVPRVQLTPQTTPQQATARPQTAQPQAAQPQMAGQPLLPAPPALNPDGGAGARISPALPSPAQNFNPKVTYQTTPRLPASFNQVKARQSVETTQGMARLLTFQNNILSVFFSDPNVMDARAINARTIAVTGTGAGQSTLAVFTERYPGDAVGYASVYRVDTLARGSAKPVAEPSPGEVESALTTALSDPRIRVSVVKLPEGSLAARLTGVVRNEAEVQGALTTASFFTPRVLPSVYADVNAPSIDAVMSGAFAQTPSDALQDNLRRITGNSSIELVSMPGSLVLKAEAESQEDAQNLLQLLPTLNQPVVPFVTIRGGGRVESSNIPLLQGEDLQLTQKLQAVTGVRTVYAVRASGNSVAIYGTVRDRSEYQAVKRYGLVIAQTSAPVALQGATQGGSVFRPQGGEPPPLPAYDPAAGYARQLGVQMFVRILDPTQATVRNVTIETNIVEITRTNLKNLGVEYGSATLLTENITRGLAGTSTAALDGNGNPIVDANGNVVRNTTPGTPSSVQRTIDPSFNSGSALLGNGFIGQGGFGAINPFRARINAIAQNTNARVLASPNAVAVEGTVAQITIGGERPVPTASASFGANAQSIEFRRFGVILTMRPTVSDDDTIILQIRADVTQPDSTYAINVGGAIIPGESVRSIDTTIVVRPGDILVMGGLLTNDKRQQTSKVPILGDIPILGSLFRSKRYENNETELAIFMTPRIDALPATMHTDEVVNRIPSFPALPGRQESSGALFQNTTRQPGA